MSVASIERQLRFLYYKMKMLEFKFKETPTHETKQRFFDISDTFDEKLSEYYSERLFELKLINEELFLTYLTLHKETVNRNWLSELIVKWDKK